MSIFPAVGEATKQLAKPVYDDALKPAAIETGKVLETAAKAVNALLMPLRVGIFAFDQIEEILQKGVAKRLSEWSTKEGDMRTPPTNIAVPAIQALQYHASIEELREMFLNLVASSMDASRASVVHPAFVDIIKQISPDEARILTLFFQQGSLPMWSFEANWHVLPPAKGGYYRPGPTFYRLSLIGKDAGCEFSARVPAYADNLLRLGIVYRPRPCPSHVSSQKDLRNPMADSSHPSGRIYFHTGERISELIDLYPELEEVASKFGKQDYFQVYREELRLNEFGKSFCLSCVAPHLPHLIQLGTGDEHLYNDRILLG